MTGTSLQRKRSESGIALLLTVSIVGIAFIVTIAAFLVGAAVSQDTERLAASKIDIATREDALMRAVLQQTAAGILPGTNGINGPTQNWTTIMTNAVNLVRATNYVDPTEMAALLPAGVIAANTGDTGGTSLGIFQGFNQEVPYGGTSNISNVLPAYSATVQPPLMNWSANPTLSATTAATFPQEFFLGSQYYSTSNYSSVSPVQITKVSPTNRWGQMTYPNIRFGFKKPGDTFVARRVWWRIPVVYQTAQKTVEDQANVNVNVNRFPSAPSNYIISAYEIPSELPITANANIQIGLNSDGSNWSTTAGGQVQINGSIYGDQVQLNGGTYNGDISSRQQVNVTKPATVNIGTNSETFSDNTYNDMGVRETKDLTRSTATTGANGQIGAAPLSVSGDNGKVLFVPVMPGNDFYMAAPGDVPTHWDLYARPYYRCGLRIIINSYDTNPVYSTAAGFAPKATAGTISVTVSVYPQIGSGPDGLLGVPTNARTSSQLYTYTPPPTGVPGAAIVVPGSNALIYTTTNTGVAIQDRNILQIDLSQLFSILQLAPWQGSIYSIYVGTNPALPPATTNSTDIGVAITGASNISKLFPSGLSIITKQRLYLLSAFNQGDPTTTPITPPVASSIYAPDVRYGISGVSPTLNVTGRVSMGQVSSGSTPTAVNPLAFSTGSNTSISSVGSTFTLTEVTDPNLIPPITRLNLLFTIEKERTN